MAMVLMMSRGKEHSYGAYDCQLNSHGYITTNISFY